MYWIERHDPNRGGYLKAEFVVDLIGDRCLETIRDDTGRCAVRVDGEQAELVAAHTCSNVDGAHLIPDRVRNPSERTVAECVAISIVERLEVIEIEQDERYGRAGSPRALDLFLEPGVKARRLRRPVSPSVAESSCGSLLCSSSVEGERQARETFPLQLGDFTR
jgi:hypothetical protein